MSNDDHDNHAGRNSMMEVCLNVRSQRPRTQQEAEEAVAHELQKHSVDVPDSDIRLIARATLSSPLHGAWSMERKRISSFSGGMRIFVNLIWSPRWMNLPKTADLVDPADVEIWAAPVTLDYSDEVFLKRLFEAKISTTHEETTEPSFFSWINQPSSDSGNDSVLTANVGKFAFGTITGDEAARLLPLVESAALEGRHIAVRAVLYGSSVADMRVELRVPDRERPDPGE